MKSNNRIDIVRDIKQGIEENRYKDCIHLYVSEPGPYTSGSYRTACKKSAFETRYPHGIGVSPPTISCPEDCDLFEDKEQAEITQKEETRRTRRSMLFSNVLREIKEFMKLITDFIKALWGH